ncbi:hypothetical protein [Escherichia coli]|uniref:hypothetical protein n=1 Tax=Escherichia coli TaxID=562 RepID=UPI0014859AB4|nr:hypothetical protein [Escherichia coli]
MKTEIQVVNDLSLLMNTRPNVNYLRNEKNCTILRKAIACIHFSPVVPSTDKLTA